MLTSAGGFIFSPNAQQQPGSSSSPPVQQSSPTTRISLRRAAHHAASSSGFQDEETGFEDAYEEPAAPPETPQQQVMAPSPAFTAPSRAITKHIPQTLALGHAPPMAHGIQLVSPHQLPDRFRQVFPYELFNAVQSKCFAPIYKTNDNVVVSAPTGSGKTALLELAICKLVEGHPSEQFKIVYQAPTKSLCSERMRDWQKKFSQLNLACAELTGDTGSAEMNRVGAASIIVTTPEKWDSITRKWKDYSRLLQLVKLFLIDEVHILRDTRGATLEAVVSRMKTSGANVRFVALSATVPNSQDIAVWLGKDHTNDHIPAHRETFGEDFRPVKLQKHVYGFDGMKNEFVFEKILDGKLPNLIQRHTHKKPIMVFCFTRNSCEATAVMLTEWWTRQTVVDRAWPAPAQKANVMSKELRELVGCGVAFHHAGLDPQDRHAIEAAFLRGDISVICCTSTLAVGVNLPCHLVVLKGTVCFQDGHLCEYSDLEVMQMLGRAGRPQFDDSAVAIIMTRSENAERYKKMISGQDILESTLHRNLIEHLNSEIGLGTVRDLYTAKKWLMGTFLSVRMRQNPHYYKLDDVTSSTDSDERLGLICERDIKLLQDNELVEDKEGRLVGTEYGQAMSRYMVQFDTMKLLLSLPSKATTEQIVSIFLHYSEIIADQFSFCSSAKPPSSKISG
jgi:ATP-dependent DNA helicase HFM1/MER3